MKKSTVVLVSMIMFSSGQLAFAAEQEVQPNLAERNDKAGFYLGLEGGWSSFSRTSTISAYVPFIFDSNTTLKCKTNSAIFSLVAGYQFNAYLAAELRGGVIPYANMSATTNIFDTSVSSTSEYIYEADLKGFIPLNNNFSLFGKVGIASLNLGGVSLNSDLTHIEAGNIPAEHAITPTLGAGINYAFTEHVSINGYYSCYLPKKSFNTTNVVGLGLNYKF